MGFKKCLVFRRFPPIQPHCSICYYEPSHFYRNFSFHPGDHENSLVTVEVQTDNFYLYPSAPVITCCDNNAPGMFDDLSLYNFSGEGEGLVTRRVIFG